MPFPPESLKRLPQIINTFSHPQLKYKPEGVNEDDFIKPTISPSHRESTTYLPAFPLMMSLQIFTEFKEWQ